ncbi:MAG TPA: DUF1653 domain-containing protein [Candidatus Saccharimonadales bacterium]|jgi:hypothetical protein|nr:DUF1653 domain-containing protein [Candidatus Saccharimonadales bacterium]
MSEKEPQERLAERLRAAEAMVTVGGLYSHYKDPDNSYIVRDVILDEATTDPLVYYQANYGERIKYGRPLSSWLAVVEIDGKTVPRFSKIEA